MENLDVEIISEILAKYGVVANADYEVIAEEISKNTLMDYQIRTKHEVSKYIKANGETAERLEQAEKDAIDLAKDIIALKGDSHKIYSRIAEMAKKANAVLSKYAEQTKP